MSVRDCLVSSPPCVNLISNLRRQCLYKCLYKLRHTGHEFVHQVQQPVAGNSHVDMILTSARAEGFSGGLYVDFPHKGLAKKYFLCLSKGNSGAYSKAQNWSQACPLALPLQCTLSSAVSHTSYSAAYMHDIKDIHAQRQTCACTLHYSTKVVRFGSC